MQAGAVVAPKQPEQPETPRPVEGSPFSPEQLLEITTARIRGRKISRAATVATFSGWSLAVFAFFSLLLGIFDLTTFILGICFCGTAYFELRGAKGLRALDVNAPRLLAINQLVLAAMVCLYAVWGMLMAMFGPGPYDDYLAGGGDVAEVIEPFAKMTRAITALFYAVVIAVTVILCGCTASYYYSRRKQLISYLRETPPWVVEMLRKVVG